MRNFVIGIAVVAAALATLTGCPPRQQYTGKDAEMMKDAKMISRLIDNYFSDSSDYPDTLDQLKPMLTPDQKWPDNPYDGKPIADTGSPKFNPATSVGMVYYEKVFRDGQQVSYMLHVFGDKGKLYIIGNTAFGAKE